MVSASLIRYNFRVLAFQNGWLLTIPLAASQLSVFWVGSTQEFRPSLPATVVETVTPLLGAFLTAHLLSAEYRSAVGAVLACKPVDIRKVVLIRLALALVLVWGLAGLSLLAFTLSMQPFPLGPPLVACAVSTLFLSALALNFATLLRHPLGGFGIAALWWALDLPPGPPMNPYLSLKGLANSFRPPGLDVPQPLTDSWWISKAVLLVAGLLLFALHNRLIFLLGTPQTVKRTRRTLISAVSMLAFVVVSGAVVKVGYGYANRTTLFPNDLGWFRRQFGTYGLLPVSSLFGRDFVKYLGEIPNAWRVQQDGESDIMGDTPKHRKEVRELVEKSPKSLWAPSAAYQTAMWEAKPDKPTDERVGYWQVIVEKYPTSPYAVEAQAQIASLWEEAPDSAKALAAWKRLLELDPKGKYASSGWRYLTMADQKDKNWESAQRNAQSWVQASPVHEAFQAWMALSEIQAARGDTAGAEQSRGAVKEAIDAFRKAAREGKLTISEPKRVRVEAEVHALEAKLSGKDPKQPDAPGVRQRGNFPGAFGGGTPAGGGRPGGMMGGGRPGGMMGRGFGSGMGRPGGDAGSGGPGASGPGASGGPSGAQTPPARP